MKNLYLWMVGVMVCIGILPMAAQDNEVHNIQFSVNVVPAEAVKCTINGQEYALTDGVNAFDLPEGTSLYFSGQAPWKINDVKNKAGQKPSSGFYGNDWYVYANEYTQDEEFTIEVVNIDDLRTAQFTINVDDPSLVNATVTGYYTQLQLKAGENIVKYQPGVETYLNLSPVNYEVPFYSVKKNGVEVAPQGNSYGIQLTNDCVIDITAILPDEDRTVDFTYSDGAENSITIKVNNQDMPDFDGQHLAVKLGDRLTIEGNMNTYKFESVKINNQEISFYGSYTFPVMKNSNVYISARAYGNISATVTVNHPELITISNNGQVLDLQAGTNVIALPENQSSIMWNVDPMGILKSVSVNGGEPLSSYQSSYALSNGDAIVFDIVEKVMDMEAIVWVDNVKGKACNNYLGLDSPSDRNVRFNLEDGYNILAFYQGMNPFSLSWNGYSEENPQIGLTGKVYLNDQLQSAVYEGSTTYNLTLASGDVLKLFMDSDPVKCDVAFDMAEGVNATVVKDVISVVENPSAGFGCFAGTQVKVSGSNLAVKVNGKEISAEEVPGVPEYVFTVEDKATTVTVANAGESGVEAIDTSNDTAVYNMQGVKVGTRSQLRSLAPGLYIVAGRKVVVTE